MVLIVPSTPTSKEADGAAEEADMYELEFRMAVDTDRRTFLLLEGAQALAHSKILRRENDGTGSARA